MYSSSLEVRPIFIVSPRFLDSKGSCKESRHCTKTEESVPVIVHRQCLK